MNWAAGLVTALVGAVGAVTAMWRGEWLHDKNGTWDANAYHFFFVAVAAVAGFAFGLRGGLVAGLATVVAALNVIPTMVVGWFLTGGDGDSDTAVAGLLGLAVAAGGVITLVVALRADVPVAATQLALMSVSAVATLLSIFFTTGRGRVRALLPLAVLFAVPAGIHGMWAAVG